MRVRGLLWDDLENVIKIEATKASAGNASTTVSNGLYCYSVAVTTEIRGANPESLESQKLYSTFEAATSCARGMTRCLCMSSQEKLSIESVNGNEGTYEGHIRNFEQRKSVVVRVVRKELYPPGEPAEEEAIKKKLSFQVALLKYIGAEYQLAKREIIALYPSWNEALEYAKAKARWYYENKGDTSFPFWETKNDTREKYRVMIQLAKHIDPLCNSDIWVMVTKGQVKEDFTAFGEYRISVDWGDESSSKAALKTVACTTEVDSTVLEPQNPKRRNAISIHGECSIHEEANMEVRRSEEQQSHAPKTKGKDAGNSGDLETNNIKRELDEGGKEQGEAGPKRERENGKTKRKRPIEWSLLQDFKDVKRGNL